MMYAHYHPEKRARTALAEEQFEETDAYQQALHKWSDGDGRDHFYGTEAYDDAFDDFVGGE